MAVAAVAKNPIDENWQHCWNYDRSKEGLMTLPFDWRSKDCVDACWQLLREENTIAAGD